MFTTLKRKLQSKKAKVLMMTCVMFVLSAFPAFAAEVNTDMTSLLAAFTQVAAWMWAEVGLLLTFILGQPILLVSMSLFFVGAVAAFFIRVFHSV